MKRSALLRRLIRKRDANAALKKVDGRPVNLAKDDICAVVVGVNELTRIPWFLQYYRRVGVTKFFIIDNNSSDGSKSYLLNEPDVHVFDAQGSYLDARAGLDWSQEVLDTYCDGRWTLIVDFDEILVFPGSEHVPLATLCRYLEGLGARGLYTIMIDMYPEGPIGQIDYTSGESFLSACGFFDSDSYYAVGVRRYPSIEIRGGPRERCFFEDNEGNVPPPPLKKVPLVKWSRGYRFTSSTHFIEPPIQLADISGCLLHFKFFGDFVEHARTEIARGERWKSGAQYKRYLRAFEEDSQFRMHYPGSTRFSDSSDLVGLGLMKPSPQYAGFLQKHFRSGGIGELVKEQARERARNYEVQLSDVLALWPAVRAVAAFRNQRITDEPLGYEGACQRAGAAGIEGWAINRPNPRHALTLNVHLDGKLHATVRADRYTDDNDALSGHRFAFKYPAEVWDGKVHELAFWFSGTNIQLDGSPVRITPSMLRKRAPKAMQEYVGRLRNLLSDVK